MNTKTTIDDVGAIFRDRIIDFIGEEQVTKLGELAATLAELDHPELLGMLCEGWTAGGAVEPTLSLLERLAPRQTMRAVIAQRVCRDNPLLTQKLLPFYMAVSGLRLKP